MVERWFCAAAALVLLTGCSAVKNPEKLAASVRDVYAAAPSVELVADITSDLDEETMTYRIGYTQEQDEQGVSAVMTVLAPASIAGISAEITGEDFVFSYEDAELETAMPDRKGLTPADVLTYLLYDLRNTVPAQVWKEGDWLALRYEAVTEAYTAVKEVYLHAQTGALHEARIYCDGKQIMRCAFESCPLK